jgi:site-specific DNA recombinase
VRVGIYTRISLDREGDSFSPERQERLCRQLAEARGWEVVRVETDRSKSGWKKGTKRPGFDALLRAVDRREVDVVMAYSLTRLGRRTVDLLELLEYLRERGAALALYDLNIDTSTAIGQMFYSFVAGMAQLEAEQTSERVKSYNRVAAESGHLHGGGCRQFGYERSGAVNRAEAGVVREAARRLTEGESLRSVATDLNSRGVVTSTGRAWSGPTLRQMMTSPRLAGIRVHNGQERPGTWEPVLSPDERRALLDALERRRPKVATRTTAAHLLTGLVRCGVCGGAMKTMGFRMKDGRTFPRYQCVKQPGAQNCGGVAVTKNTLDAHVTNAVLDFVSRATMTLAEPESGVTLEQLEKLVAEDEAGLADLTDARFVHRLIGDEEFRAARAKLQERLTENRERLTVLQGRAEAVSGALRPGDREALQAWWDAASIEERRAALRGALHEVRVNRAARRGGNKFDPSRVELRWRLDFYARAADARRSAMTEEQRAAAAAAYEAEREAAGDPAEGWE